MNVKGRSLLFLNYIGEFFQQKPNRLAAGGKLGLPRHAITGLLLKKFATAAPHFS